VQEWQTIQFSVCSVASVAISFKQPAVRRVVCWMARLRGLLRAQHITIGPSALRAALRAFTKIVWNNFEHPRFLRMARRVSHRDVANKIAPGDFVEP